MVYNIKRELCTTITIKLKVIMVSAINANQYNIGYQELEVMRRLQSLGINPTGNLSVDRQTLQRAEIVKRQNTLSAGNIQNLSNLEGSGFAFKDALNSVGKTESTNTYQNPVQQTGAMQIAELNRYQLGI